MLPMKDIRLFDLGAVVAAPFAATMLGDFGAEVIKIEPRDVPDAIRFWSVVEGKYQPYWLANSRKELPITLNLSTLRGRKFYANWWRGRMYCWKTCVRGR